MADQDTLYFELLDALQAGGCILCHLGRRSATRFIDTLNYEGVNDPGLRRTLRDAHGFCHHHAWEWAQMRGSPLGVAIVYRNIVEVTIEALEKPAPADGRAYGSRRRAAPRRAAPRLAASGRCPACRVEGEAVERYSQTLLVHLDEPDLAQAYRAAGGLCLPHLRTVLALADEAQSRTVQGWQLEIFHNLDAQLNEFIRKHDYRFSQEPFGDEKDSWARAIAAFAGEADTTS